jgi:hypothetical protein
MIGKCAFVQGMVVVVMALLVQISNSASAGTAVATASGEEEGDQRRIYDFKQVGGAGCPYTASWLADINLYRGITWFVDSTKMEAASFRIFDTAKLKFQVADPDAYYVHHMSMYEHHIHRKQGFAAAQRETLVLSQAAMHGECGDLKIRPTNEYIALIPFFGGLPPGVTADFSKVKSIGQGNSLVNASTKALQCMATLCSTLKYYGHAVIGVVRDSDRELMLETIDSLAPHIRAHTAVVQLAVPKNANLPFHMLAWGQSYIKKHNCGLLNKPVPVPGAATTTGAGTGAAVAAPAATAAVGTAAATAAVTPATAAVTPATAAATPATATTAGAAAAAAAGTPAATAAAATTAAVSAAPVTTAPSGPSKDASVGSPNVNTGSLDKVC